MSKRRMMFRVGGTVLCALAIGYFIQSDQEPPVPVAPAPTAVQQAIAIPVVQPGPGADRPIDLTGILLTSTQPEIRAPRPMPAPELEGATATKKRDCPITARATAAPMAMVQLDVAAPCMPNERLTIHHSGMMFTDVTDVDGDLQVMVPALADKAVFIVAFANGRGAVASAHVDDLVDVDRVALQWRGRNGFELHALEFGAGYDDPGHVWYKTATTGSKGEGRMVRLGDADTLAPQMVDIYTFPAGQSARSGSVAMSIEAEVTQANCGHDISAQALELRDGGGLRIRDLVLSVPGCDAAGDFLVLNNLVDDLKIASR